MDDKVVKILGYLAKTMLKKIKIEELHEGMMIVDLGRSWTNHPFLGNQKRITSPKQIQKLKDYGIQEVIIDAGGEIDTAPGLSEKDQNHASREDIAVSIESKWPSLQPSPGEPLVKEISFAQELQVAREVQREAHSIVRNYMQDIRAGKNIESKKVKLVVNQMIDSIFRNRDALTSITRIKGYDEYTFVHSINVCILCLTLGRHLNFSREELQQMGIGALLHDVGKMKVPAHILNKPGKVTEEEFAEIKKHTLNTLEVLGKAGEIPDASKQIALQHHERYNGKGYPYGLVGDQISQFGQIAAIVDVYDAITSDRCYKAGIPPHMGIKKIYEWAKSDFNQVLVEKFIQSIGIYPIGTLVQLDTDEVGLVYSINHEKLLRPKVLLIYKDLKKPYSSPVLVDLMEESKESLYFKRSIIKPLDPLKWNIDVDQYLKEAISL